MTEPIPNHYDEPEPGNDADYIEVLENELEAARETNAWLRGVIHGMERGSGTMLAQIQSTVASGIIGIIKATETNGRASEPRKPRPKRRPPTKHG